MVGRRSFPFGARLIFRGELLNFQGVQPPSGKNNHLLGRQIHLWNEVFMNHFFLIQEVSGKRSDVKSFEAPSLFFLFPFDWNLSDGVGHHRHSNWAFQFTVQELILTAECLNCKLFDGWESPLDSPNTSKDRKSRLRSPESPLAK